MDTRRDTGVIWGPIHKLSYDKLTTYLTIIYYDQFTEHLG